MTISTEDLLNSIMESFDRIDYIKTADIPNIDLYMDQVTTFMDHRLKSTTRQETDKILTKTMINNYAKNDLLPPPVKKKYSKEHILMLIFIYYFKSILSINDIESILNPLAKRFFNAEGDFNLTTVYEEVFSLERDEVKNLMKDITKKFNTSSTTFADAPEEDQDFLHTFSFICMLSFDVFVKCMLIEKLIDETKEMEKEAEDEQRAAEKKASEGKKASEKKTSEKKSNE